MKPRLNLFLLVGGIVFLLLIGISGYLLFRGFSDLADSEARLADRLAVLKGFFNKNPFPSVVNVAREKENAQKLGALYDSLLADLSKEQIRPTGLSPSTFMKVLSEKRDKLVAEAKASGTVLVPELGFGFEKYLVETGSSLPAPEHVPRLTQQLMIVEHFCTILFSERVRELSVVKREEFEGVGPVPASPGTPRPPRQGSLLPAASVARISKAGVLGTNDLYTAFRFTLEFKAEEKALTAILNRMASSGIFVVTRKVTMTKETPDVVEIRAPSAASPADDARPAATNAVSPRDMTRQQRLVSGLGKESSMKVALELEAYRFREPAH